MLDELTTGVDPVSRVGIWRLITGAAAEGAAVVTATSYLDEAERATTVLLLHRGHTLAHGSPQSVIDGVAGTVVDRDVPDDRDTSWRRGRRWRQWLPHENRDSDDVITLEDAAIVLELQAGGR
ncbi:MAG: ABC transporter ATP-binding protein, partial [Actinobacteria bacterium]|nr:ABC transporter ATP-binding protein [Actinomycetota bacterium]NIS35401.1 ABC transporter ATP-binding protein [Actinomycetota bacterium]NIW28087.1 ABC transporter ATP-binding protein [Actinomycetota bacterium]NIX20572.1 ABC transporter ATP-binding protein [Actinomycetota bacterium]